MARGAATNLHEGRALLDVWRRTKLVGMIGFNYRFNPMHQLARQHVQRNELGELVSVRSVFASAARVLPEWKKSRETGGGALGEVS